MIQAFSTSVIGVLTGGFSKERAVSLRSGKNVYDALLRLGYQAVLLDPVDGFDPILSVDVVFNVMHGEFGEDGAIQALLDRLGKKYVGSGAAASVLGMNKFYTKTYLTLHQLPTPDFLVAREAYSALPSQFSYPVMVKPCSGGSSVDTFVCDTDEELKAHTTHLVTYYETFLMEQFIEGREFTIGLIERPEIQALPILELIPKNRFYDYEAKYTPGMTTFVLPAPLPDAVTEQLHALAKKVHQLVGCKGMSRVDVILDKAMNPYILEINTLPGLTDLSDLPAQAKEAGISFDALVEILLASALD